MFHKLRLKLTLINATVIAILFLMLIAGTYYYSHEKIVHLSDELSARIMYDLKTDLITDLPQPPGIAGKDRERGFPLPPPPPHGMFPEHNQGKPLLPGLIERPFGPSFFFVKISPAGSIVSQSSNQPLSEEKRNELLTLALQTGANKGQVILGDNEYRYLKSSMDTSETILLFQDFTKENHMLRIQLTALTVVGLICLILSLLGSFLMANRAMIPIQQTWQQQKDFLSDASHELRTPLTVIQTNLEIVVDSQNETVASQLKWLHNIQEETTAMAKLVDSLLFLARSDANQQMLEIASFSLTQTLIETAAAFEPLAQAKELAIDVFAPAEIKFAGDRNRIKQVISILLDNAIRHTSSGKISLQLCQTAGKICLTVSDSGEGIAPESINKIFDRFYQVDKARSKGGAGLGLSIARSIIENHKGTIQVASSPGFGTTFTIDLPVQQG